MALRIPRRATASLLIAAALAVFAATPVLAASNRTYSGYLPGGDYIQSNIWIGNMSWNNKFNAQSSTWILGNNPYYPYYTEDSMTINVNGIAIHISASPGADWTTISSANYTSSETYTGYAGNLVYNIALTGGIWWNNTGTDTSKTILYPNTQSYYNHSDVTNWL